MKEIIPLRDRNYISSNILIEKFGITRATFKDWLAKELLPNPIKLGRRMYFDEAEVERRIFKSQ